MQDLSGVSLSFGQCDGLSAQVLQGAGAKKGWMCKRSVGGRSCKDRGKGAEGDRESLQPVVKV